MFFARCTGLKSAIACAGMSAGPPLSRTRLRDLSRTAQRFVTFLAILAFTFQCILVQSHVHGPQEAPPAVHSVSVSVPVLPGPGDEDPANCPLCQEMLHAGTYVTPIAIPIYLPIAATLAATPAPTAVFRVFAPSHNWQGRAPPRV
jgi:hypothetical protein